MPRDRNVNPRGLGDWANWFLALCLSLLVGSLALNWAMRLLEGVWVQLAIVGGALSLAAGIWLVVHWRRNRW